MKSAMDWIVISNEIMQWKKINRADKANFFIIVLRYLEALISWSFPAGHRVLMFALSLFCRWSFYILLLPNTHTNENLSSQKRSVGVYGGTYSEPTSRIHGYFIIVALKRISFPLSINLNFCLSQDS